MYGSPRSQEWFQNIFKGLEANNEGEGGRHGGWTWPEKSKICCIWCFTDTLWMDCCPPADTSIGKGCVSSTLTFVLLKLHLTYEMDLFKNKFRITPQLFLGVTLALEKSWKKKSNQARGSPGEKKGVDQKREVRKKRVVNISISAEVTSDPEGGFLVFLL